MLKIPKKTLDRFAATIKPFQVIVEDIIARDVSEADTVTVVKDILADVFGFNKYTELTSEQQIRGTFCDLAVKLDSKVKFLVEVKSAGTETNDSHIRQAVNYGVHEGIEWIVLTNASVWRLYRVRFSQPVEYDEVLCFNLRTANPKDEEDQQRLFLLCREAIALDAMDAFHQNALLLNKHTVGFVLTSETMVNLLRREMRRLFPDLKVDQEKLAELLTNEVVKRDVLEGDKAKDSQTRVRKAQQKLARLSAKKERTADDDPTPAADVDPPTSDQCSTNDGVVA